MTRQRKRLDTSLKLEVVRMIKEQGFSVQRSCCILGVSRSGYYDARRRLVSALAMSGFTDPAWFHMQHES